MECGRHTSLNFKTNTVHAVNSCQAIAYFSLSVLTTLLPMFNVLLSVPAVNTYLWSTFCLSLLSTLLPRVNVFLSVPSVNTVTYGQCSSVSPCCEYCYLWSTIFILCGTPVMKLITSASDNIQTSQLLNLMLVTRICLNVFNYLLLLLLYYYYYC